jgi:hypothetical protein
MQRGNQASAERIASMLKIKMKKVPENREPIEHYAHELAIHVSDTFKQYLLAYDSSVMDDEDYRGYEEAVNALAARMLIYLRFINHQTFKAIAQNEGALESVRCADRAIDEINVALNLSYGGWARMMKTHNNLNITIS